jgi:hypothetical protein
MRTWMPSPCNLRCLDGHSHDVRQYVLRIGLLRRRNSAGLRSIAMHGKTSTLLKICLLLIGLYFPLLIVIFCVTTVRPGCPFAKNSTCRFFLGYTNLVRARSWILYIIVIRDGELTSNILQHQCFRFKTCTFDFCVVFQKQIL